MSKHSHRPVALPAIQSDTATLDGRLAAARNAIVPHIPHSAAATAGTARVFFAYSRYSTSTQHISSLTRQHKTIARYVQKLGPYRIRYFDDAGKSAADTNRPALQQIRDLVRQGLATDVAVEDFDRWSREIFGAVEICKELNDAGVRFHSAAEERELTKEDVVQAAIRAERDRLRRRNLCMSGMDQLIEAGGVPHSNVYGYRRGAVPGFPEIEEESAAVIRQIAAMLAAGLSLNDVCARLNAEAHPTPKGSPSWRTSSVRAIIGNVLLTGRIEYRIRSQKRDEHGRYETKYSAPDDIKHAHNERYRILSDAAFIAANEALRSKAVARTYTKPDPANVGLAGCVTCDCSGAKNQRYFRTIVREKGKKVIRYVCNLGPRCEAPTRSFNGTQVERTILHVVAEELSAVVDPAEFAAECKRRRAETERRWAERRAEVAAELEDKRDVAERALDKELREGPSEELSRYQARLKADTEKISKVLRELDAVPAQQPAASYDFQRVLENVRGRTPFIAASEPDAGFALALRNVVPMVRVGRTGLPLGQVRISMSVDMDAPFSPLMLGMSASSAKVVEKVVGLPFSTLIDKVAATNAADKSAAMGEHRIDDRRWAEVEPHLKDVVGQDRYGITNRQVADAVVFCMRTQIPISRTPSHFGPPEHLYKLIQRFAYHGNVEILLDVLTREDPAWTNGMSADGLSRLKRHTRQRNYAMVHAWEMAADGRHSLSDAQWDATAAAVHHSVAGIGDSAVEPRKVIDAILVKLRSGCSWRHLPTAYGNPIMVQRAISRLVYTGSWDKVQDVWRERHPEVMAGLPLGRILKYGTALGTLPRLRRPRERAVVDSRQRVSEVVERRVVAAKR